MIIKSLCFLMASLSLTKSLYSRTSFKKGGLGWIINAKSTNRMKTRNFAHQQEYLLYSKRNENNLDTIQKFAVKQNISISSILNEFESSKGNKELTTWEYYRDDIQLDNIILEPYWLGKVELSTEEVFQKWFDSIETRKQQINTLFNNYNRIVTEELRDVGDGGKFQKELNVAVSIVQTVSYISRSLQYILFQKKDENDDDDDDLLMSMDKTDNSPVTIADFVCQALIIDVISKAFPQDKIIAEEDSEMLRKDAKLTSSIVKLLSSVTGNDWNQDRLYSVLDKGTFDGGEEETTTNAQRVWALDPIDGTKGFIRGEHYCIALALLCNGTPRLSVLGCPNLSLNNVLESTPSNAYQVIPNISLPYITNIQKKKVFFPTHSGSVFFAVSGHGAYARSLSMPIGSAVEVTVDYNDNPENVALCEAVKDPGKFSTVNLILYYILF